MDKAIIFDMDGILVKTIHIAEEIVRKKLEEHGITINEEELSHLSGYSWKEFLEYIYKNRNIDEIKGLYEDILEAYSKILSDKVVLYEGAGELLETLSSEFDLALVSGSLKKDIITNLTKFGLLKYFKIIISAEEVENGKPAPDLYLAAAKILKKTLKIALV